MRKFFVAITVVAGTLGLASCGSDVTDPQALLRQAQQLTNNTPELHFHISSNSQPTSVNHPFLLTADGDVLRPSGFSGSLEVDVSGVTVPVSLIATGGRFWVRPPFSSTWSEADPHAYGFNDPGLLLDTKHGLSVLLDSPQKVRLLSRDRLLGEELNEVQFEVPGSQVSGIFPGGESQSTDEITAGIAVATGQLRRLVITGPIVVTGQSSTYAIVLDRYNESVQITPPT